MMKLVSFRIISFALRILNPPMETPDPPNDTPGASKQVVLTPHDIPRILRVAKKQLHPPKNLKPISLIQVTKKLIFSRPKSLTFLPIQESCTKTDPFHILGKIPQKPCWSINWGRGSFLPKKNGCRFFGSGIRVFVFDVPSGIN